MKPIIILVIIIVITTFSSLSAQQTASIQQLENLAIAHNDTLTSSYSGFIHTNWSQAGVGINVKHILLMYNKTVFPLTKNYKADKTMSDVMSQNPNATYDISYSYDTIMAGYIIRLTKNIYPYAGSGTVIRTEMIKVYDNTESPDEYTVKGKEVTFASGIVGAIFTVKKNLIVEGSVQFNPLLPFVGVGLSF